MIDHCSEAVKAMATSLRKFASMPFLFAVILSPLISAHAQIATPATWYVTIILPQKVVAGHPATLAVLGSDGRLAPCIDCGNQ